MCYPYIGTGRNTAQGTNFGSTERGAKKKERKENFREFTSFSLKIQYPQPSMRTCVKLWRPGAVLPLTTQGIQALPPPQGRGLWALALRLRLRIDGWKGNEEGIGNEEWQSLDGR